MRATRWPSSNCVASVCQMLEPAALISIEPLATPETPSLTGADTSVGSLVDGGSNASCGGPGVYRHGTRSDAVAGSALPAASRLHTDTVKLPGPGAWIGRLAMP